MSQRQLWHPDHGHKTADFDKLYLSLPLSASVSLSLFKKRKKEEKGKKREKGKKGKKGKKNGKEEKGEKGKKGKTGK